LQIILDFTEEEAALLERAVILENKQRRKLSMTYELEDKTELSEHFRKDLTLTEYALATLLVVAEKEVSERE